ncbi:MAG: putative deacylase [Myxococcota bacterium]|jgi:multidrug efflux pump subunit AcrA (membrane-fusion protein)
MSTALIQDDQLLSPTVGVFTPATVLGGPVHPGMVLGHVLQTGRRVAIVVPEGMAGSAIELVSGQWVECGTVVCRVGEGTGGVFVVPQAVSADVPVGCTAICAETDGTVYLRSEPSSPPFVSVDDDLAAGTTLALVEVMKTFTPVRAISGGVLSEVRVTDGQSVSAGQVLFVIA